MCELQNIYRPCGLTIFVIVVFRVTSAEYPRGISRLTQSLKCFNFLLLRDVMKQLNALPCNSIAQNANDNHGSNIDQPIHSN